MIPPVLHYTHLQVCENNIVCEVHFPWSVAIKRSGSERVKISSDNKRESL